MHHAISSYRIALLIAKKIGSVVSLTKGENA